MKSNVMDPQPAKEVVCIRMLVTKDRVMIHYSCDRCKRILDPEEDLRYVVKLEVYAEIDPVDAEDVEDDRDHLLEISEILERLEDSENDYIGDDVYQKKRFDLCAECYKKYIRNPLGREVTAPLGFSQN